MMTKEEAQQILAAAALNLNLTVEEKAKVLQAIQVLAGSWATR